MARKNKKDFIPSNNFCIVCGRYTNEKKYFGENWSNYFFFCPNCKKVWCGECMGQVAGTGPNKTFRLGKKGKITCPECDSFTPMVKLPTKLPFIQKKGISSIPSSVDGEIEIRFCKFCGESISSKAIYCQICGAKQD